MRITLIHNPTAGGKDHTRESLLAALERAGHDVVYWSSKDDRYLDALRNPGKVVAVAGGDGTVDKVARRLMDSEAAIAILPMGTANNIARTLGIHGDVATLIESWNGATAKAVDMGVARSPWGEVTFIEAAGVGFFPQMIPAVNALRKQGFGTVEHPDDKLDNDLASFQKLMNAAQSHDWQVLLDGKSWPGQHLLFEVMNIKYLGPQMCLAPDADPCDGLFDVVLVEEHEREALADYLERCLRGDAERPDFPVRRAQHIEFLWNGSEVHVDSEVWAEQATLFGDVDAPPQPAPARIELSVRPNAVKFLL